MFVFRQKSYARGACKPDSVQGLPPLDDHSSWPAVTNTPLAANPNIKAEGAHATFLFGIAPGGACRAGPVARPAVGSYSTVSPLPRACRGGLFSVALSLGLPPPGVTRHRSFRESGLSSGIAARDHPAPRAKCQLSGAGRRVNAETMRQISRHSHILSI